MYNKDHVSGPYYFVYLHNKRHLYNLSIIINKFFEVNNADTYYINNFISHILFDISNDGEYICVEKYEVVNVESTHWKLLVASEEIFTGYF